MAGTIGAVLSPGVALATPKTIVSRYGPVRLGPYQVARGDQVFNIPKPDVDGYLTRMSARLVYADGKPVPIANTMLHHMVFANIGAYVGQHQDATCERFRMFDSQSFLPLSGERFYGIGEERLQLELPQGYGYPIARSDRWAMTYMLMNHLPRPETVYLEYTTDVETEQVLKPVMPLWLDVRDCNLDPVFDVPGGGAPGATVTTSTTWTAPEAGRLVAGAGHLHGGGEWLDLRRPDCGSQELFRSTPVWGLPTHPYYQVRPLLHEPGPISMSEFSSVQGIPVAKGERVELTATYDATRPHVRVMGIMLVAFAPDPSVTAPCAPLPSDLRSFQLRTKGRLKMPRITVPITAVPRAAGAAGARAVVISRPPGDTVAEHSGATIDVADNAFAPANVAVSRGATLRWHFFGEALHNVTLANGPLGFSSDNLNGEREFSHRFTRPGTYRIFCTLHPTLMSETVQVR